MTHPVLDIIEAQIAARHLLTHPFYQAWQRGELTPQALSDYATQYYHHVAAFPTYLSALHSHTPAAATRRALLENLVDEEAGHPNHPELWLDFAAGVGATPETVLATEAQPETKALVAVFDDICRHGSVAAGLAALYSYESQIPAVAETKIDGLTAVLRRPVGRRPWLTSVSIRRPDVAHAAAERGLLQCHLDDADASDAATRLTAAPWTPSGRCFPASASATGSPADLMKISAVFLDRDGVLNPHIPGGYLLSADDLVVLPGVAQAVRRLNDAGLPVIVISNQQGVGKGLMTMADLTAIERRMEEALRHEAGARIDRCYYSTELAAANSPRRKPGPGMLLEAAQDFGLTCPRRSSPGIRRPTFRRATPPGSARRSCCSPAGRRPTPPGDMTPAPDFVFPGLPDAVDWILEQTA